MLIGQGATWVEAVGTIGVGGVMALTVAGIAWFLITKAMPERERQNLEILKEIQKQNIAAQERMQDKYMESQAAQRVVFERAISEITKGLESIIRNMKPN